ncbi:MAG: EscU/YscU/HrcU family type III secretion system export apparatus switch protein, partial [Nitrospirae bacterium]|nr:EscU/YscU/HrcU family type III secretion system export apparatus switch protein [Nitrospirota bacterium]
WLEKLKMTREEVKQEHKDAEGNELSRLVFAVDYASGDNALGGGGAGLYYYFTKNVSLLTGPVWFNEEAINGKWKWTTQLDVNF